MVRTRVKRRKMVSQVLKTRNQRQARKLRILHRHVPLTLPGTMVGMVTNGTMAEVLMNGMMSGVLLDVTKVWNKLMTLLQAYFHLEVWISVPRVVRSGLTGVKMNLDTGAAVNTFPLNFGPDGAGDGMILSDCQW